MFRKRIRLLTITILLLGLVTAAGCAMPAAEAEDIQQRIIDREIEVPITYEPTE